MNVIICDDETVYIDALFQAIDAWASRYDLKSSVNILAFHSSEELFYSYEKGLSIDALFMDIQFNNEDDGLKISRDIHRDNPFIPIVLVTNYGEYVYEGYTVNALRYLRKPIKPADVEECMNISNCSVARENVIKL